MSDLEHLMWRLDRDPLLTPSIANLSILDRQPDVDVLKRRLVAATAEVPRLRQHVVDSPGKLAPPVWRADPEFGIDAHLVVRHLPAADRGFAAVERIAGELASRPFDQARPPWLFTLLGPMDDGRWAMVQQMHHSIADGEGSLKMSLAFMDFERHPEGDTKASHTGRRTRTPKQASPKVPSDQGQAVEEASAGVGQWLADATAALGYTAQRGAATITKLVTDTAERLKHPGELTALGGEIAGIVTSLGKQIRSIEHRSSPIWRQRSEVRNFAAAQVPFASLKDASRRLDVTINDLFVAAAVNACSTYHRRRDADLPRLNVSIPVSTRHGRPGGNLFAPTISEIEIVDHGGTAQLPVVATQMSAVKSDRSIGMIEPLAGTVNLLPMPLVLQAGRWVTSHVDLVCSNIRAAPFAAYIAGAKVEANYPIGPLSGSAVNITMMTYDGSANIGVHCDSAAVPDAHEIGRLLVGELEGFVAAPGL
jgi:WS/DGAT/MGAT family acyltransferase